jgi:hypothetical protein
VFAGRITGYAAIALPTLIGPVNLPGGEGQGVLAAVNFVAGSALLIFHRCGKGAA